MALRLELANDVMTRTRLDDSEDSDLQKTRTFIDFNSSPKLELVYSSLLFLHLYSHITSQRFKYFKLDRFGHDIS